MRGPAPQHEHSCGQRRADHAHACLTTYGLAQDRLKLAVEWGRADVVQRVMADGSRQDMQLALQVAVQNRHVDIIKLLLSQTASLVQKVTVVAIWFHPAIASNVSSET